MVKKMSDELKQTLEYLYDNLDIKVDRSKFNGRKAYIKFMDGTFDLYIQVDKQLEDTFEYEVHYEYLSGRHILEDKEDVLNFFTEVLPILSNRLKEKFNNDKSN